MTPSAGDRPLHDLASIRKEYETAGLDIADVSVDPIEQWHRWYGDAVEAQCVEPNAFVLGTIDQEGWPQSRYVLVRGVDERGFTFFTNYESAKSHQLGAEPRASMLFSWLQLHRQVRVVGEVERVPEPEAVRMARSFFVWKTSFTPLVTRSMIAANSGPRWSTISAAPAWATSAGTGVGPGIRRFTVTPFAGRSPHGTTG